jgi:peroxiredoxin
LAETATLKVGDIAPDFELKTSPMGDTFKLSDQRGEHAVVINFVPAAFSGACSTQLPLIEKKRGEFESQGAMPVVISCDNAWSQKAWKEQLGVDFPVLSDFNPHGAVAKQYGVFIEQAGVANRVVIVVDKAGKVAWIQPAPKISELPDYDPVMACDMG